MNILSRLFRRYIAPHKLKLVIVSFISLFTSLTTYLFGFIGKVVVDIVIPQKNILLLFSLLGGYGLIYLFTCFARSFNRYQIAAIGQRIVFSLRRDLHQKLQNLSMRYFDQHKVGKLVARVMDDTNVIENVFTTTLVTAITNIAALVVAVVILLILDYKLAIITLTALPLSAVSFAVMRKRLKTISSDIRACNADLYSHLSEVLTGTEVVKSFAQEKKEIRNFFQRSKHLIRLFVRRVMISAGLGTTSTIISAICTGVILWLGVLRVKAGWSLGSMLWFYSTTGLLFGPVNSLTSILINSQYLMVVVKRIFGLLDEKVEIYDSEQAISLKKIEGQVMFRHVSLKYIKSKNIGLSEINFEIPAGSRVSLIGPSGSGKTSLVNLLLRLYDCTTGYIFIDGHNIKDVKLTSLRSNIAMVSQETSIFSGTAADNIKYGRMQASANEIITAAKMAEIHDFIMSLKDKYETEIGERGMSLSGGQKQRLCIARALLSNPGILILDDSSSALDAETETRIQKTLDKVMKERTCFIITHRLHTAMQADIIIVMNKGKIAEIGSHSELLKLDGGVYNRIYNKQTT